MNSNETKLSIAIKKAADAKGLSIRDLSLALDLTYEHVRRILGGMSVPSKPILRAICNILELDYNELLQHSVSARLNSKFGGIPLALAGKDPSLYPLEIVWKELTKSQQEDLIDLARGWAKKNNVVHP